MFRPVGSQPPSVYWRRRLVFAASMIALLLLIVLTAKVLLSNDPGATAAAGAGASTTPSTTRPGSSVSSSSRRPPASSSSGNTSPSTSTSTGASSSQTSSAAPKQCSAKSLALSTGTDKSTYPMDATPQLALLVKNTGTLACVQDLGDRQIVMRVYNGESRVWGSHDCKVDPTPNERTLTAGSTVQLNITWTGLSSRPNDCTTRQRVGAGTYTLYASLAGTEATAKQFTISP